MKPLQFLFAILLLSSCTTYKRVYNNSLLGLTGKKNEVYKINPNDINGKPHYHVEVYKIKDKNCIKATIEDKGDYLIIKPKDEKQLALDKGDWPFSKGASGWRGDNEGKFYFPENDLGLDNNGTKRTIAKRLTYADAKIVLQGLTVPIKIRPKLNTPSLKDSFPQQVETGVNVGVALGWKLTHNVFSAKKNIWGQNTNRYSFTPGIFCGFGGVDLKKANTRDPVIIFERKAFMVNTGVFFMLGFNNLNIGYTLGADFATGPGSKQWLYQGHIWHGVALAIDLIK